MSNEVCLLYKQYIRGFLNIFSATISIKQAAAIAKKGKAVVEEKTEEIDESGKN